MLSLNGLPIVSAKFRIPHAGSWTADLDFDLAAIPTPPTGPVAILVSETSTPALGTVDPAASGQLGDQVGKARVVGGYGWTKAVEARHFHNDAGVFSTAVLSTTAAEVLEKVLEAGPPTLLGVDYARTGGLASRVLDGLDWYVTLQGVTIVGPRAPSPPPTTLDILAWDPLRQAVEFACEELLLPGTVLVDTRFGTATVVDVEQTFDASGSRGVAYCKAGASSPKTEESLSGMFGKFIAEKGGAKFAAVRKYRFVSVGPDGRFTLQAIALGGEFPDLIAITPWPGTAGLSCKPVPGAIVCVAFADGDPAKPIVVHFDDSAPATLSLDAKTTVTVGTEALAKPVALAPAVIAAINGCLLALSTALGANPAGVAAAQAAIAEIASTKLLAEGP